MTIIRTELSDALEKAFVHYRDTHSDTPEAIVEKALKRFLLEEGYPAEDEVLSTEEIEALESHQHGESHYEAWQDLKSSL